MNDTEPVFAEDRLGNLIREAPIASPSDDFLEHVMMAVRAEPEALPEHRTLTGYIKSGLPYAALIAFFMLIYMTSDIPGLQQLPGEGLLSGMFLPVVEMLFYSIKGAFSSSYVSWGALVGVSGGLLYLIDQWFSKKKVSY